jgi:hypothetical protein
MFFVAIIFIAICVAIGLMHQDLLKTLLFLAWVGLGLMAVGATLHSVFLLLA